MSEALKQLIGETQAKFKADAEAAKATFESRSALQEGLRTEVSLRHHQLTVDEPPALGGTDSGPNPVELILAALGTCQEITYRAYATALGIPLDNVSVTVEGDIDLRGFFAVDDSVRAGYEAVRGTVHLESSASEEQLELLRGAVNAHCPVLDILSNPVPVELDLKITQTSVEAAA
ncbi:MAG: OsmC family protein [Betaproteobacteria bacterium]|nr:MAG: OsmC family protein [Betaproteobacteria bacterium]